MCPHNHNSGIIRGLTGWLFDNSIYKPLVTPGFRAWLNRRLTWRGKLKTTVEADELLEQVMGWSEDAIRLLTEILERLAELPPR